MAPEYGAGILFGIGAAVLGTAFIVIGRSARHGPVPYEAVSRIGYRIRRYWFVTVVCLGLLALGLTLPHMPYPITRLGDAGRDPLVVRVQGAQWQWTISRRSIPVDRLVKFEVTSADVNHDFAIYGPGGEIVGQVQAMPGYMNMLYLTFLRPGHYTVRCLELCGQYHTAMVASFDVTRA